VKVAYTNVDLYLRWKADDYFALDGRQTDALKTQLDAATSWHRSEELPRYSAMLLGARDRVGAGLDGEDVEWFVESARARYEALVRHSAPGAAEVLSSLTPGQIARFEAKLSRENEEFAAEFVEPPEDVQRRKRFQRSLDLVEDWVGPLSGAQRARMESMSYQLPLTNAMRHEDRQRRQRELLALLDEHRTAQTLAPALEAWLIGWDKGRAPDYEQRALESRRQTIAMLVELDRTLEPAQRSRLQAKLARYAGEFESLAANRPARAATSTFTPTGLLADVR
jgi:hypothetical protein